MDTRGLWAELAYNRAGLEKWPIVARFRIRAGLPSPARGSPRTEPEKPRVPPSLGLLYCLEGGEVAEALPKA